MLNATQVESVLEAQCNCPLFFDHEHEAFLWFDKDSDVWCISFYMIEEDKVHVDPEPTMCFARPKKEVDLG